MAWSARPTIWTSLFALIGILGPLPLAGHEIALNCASFTFMVPFAISAAASVRVGQAIGRGTPQDAASAGWAAILLGALVMTAFALAFTFFAHPIAAAFTPNAAVIAAAVPLLYVAGAFQFFDGLQITASGALRGAGNTHTGLVALFAGYWVVGVPIGAYLTFHRHMGAVGLWLGLCAGLIVAGASLTTAWRKATRKLLTPEAANTPT